MAKRRVFYICLFACVFFIIGLASGEEQKNTADEKERLIGIPNPAAVYCAKLGYKYETRKNEYGGEYGVVIFPDGTECNDWSFFKGKAGQKWSYCKRHGGKIENRVENMGTWTAESAVCVFPDGSECDETQYIDGKCGPGVYKKWSLDEKKCIKLLNPITTPRNHK